MPKEDIQLKSRIRLSMPSGKRVRGRISMLVRGRVFSMQEWMRTSDVSIAELLVSIHSPDSASDPGRPLTRFTRSRRFP